MAIGLGDASITSCAHTLIWCDEQHLHQQTQHHVQFSMLGSDYHSSCQIKYPMTLDGKMLKTESYREAATNRVRGRHGAWLHIAHPFSNAICTKHWHALWRAQSPGIATSPVLVINNKPAPTSDEKSFRMTSNSKTSYCTVRQHTFRAAADHGEAWHLLLKRIIEQSWWDSCKLACQAEHQDMLTQHVVEGGKWSLRTTCLYLNEY